MHLILIRHGQSYVNLPDWEDGYLDTGLTPLGQEQARRLAAWLVTHVAPDAIYTSSMRRALETAQTVAGALGLAVVEDDRLREIGSAWPDASPIDVTVEAPIYAEYWASERPFAPICEGGETWGDFLTRVGRALYEIAERHPGQDDTVLVVCHGGVMNAVLDLAFNVGHWRSLDTWIHNTGIVHLEYKREQRRQEIWRLHGTNLCYHLLEPDGSILGYEWQGRTPAGG